MARAGHDGKALRTAALSLLQPGTRLSRQRHDQPGPRTLSEIAGHRAALHAGAPGARKRSPDGELAASLLYTTRGITATIQRGPTNMNMIVVALLLLQAIQTSPLLENDYVRVFKNSAPCAMAAPSCGERVLVALGPIEV